MVMTARSLLLISVLALAACDSAEERAEKHFQSAIELMESGDPRRALVEFRNVFSLDNNHKEARLAFARTNRGLGNISAAYSSYLRVSEQDPQNMEARLALTEMAVVAQNWREAERHGTVLVQADPPIEGSEIPTLALNFRQAVLDGDNPRKRELTREAEILAADQPGNEILHRILIEGYVSEGEVGKAVDITDRAIGEAPDNALFYRVKAMLLAQNNDTPLLEDHLRETIKRFPDDDEMKGLLVRLLAEEGDTEGAREFLRGEIETADDKLAAHVTLIAFIQRTEGPVAALAELDVALPLHENAEVLKALQAGLLFDQGQQSDAIAVLQTVVDTSEPGGEANRYKVTLARMLIASGNEVGARQLVGEVLESEPNQVEALKMSADWLIEEDEADEAISTLRRALDQEPEDAQAMTLMARAHERNGNAQLAQDLLALAVDASGNGAAESLRFANSLVEQNRLPAAEEVLIKGLRTSPGDFQMLNLLGQIYLRTEDWARADQVVQTLRRQETDRAKVAADQLQLQVISRVEGQDQGIAFLEAMANSDTGNAGAKVALIRARLEQNDTDTALALAQELVAEFPDNPRARQVLGNTQFAAGDFEAAEATLGALASETGIGTDVLQFARVLGAQGKGDDARAAIDQGLEKTPDSADLLWAKASYLERDNDIDGAIEIYELLYEENSASPIIANNLASLLATYRTDEASLERAFTVARRLRGATRAPFQDTYGWILFRRGDAEEALTYLEPAAQTLDRDPIVQYHLGRIYEELGRADDAVQQYDAVIELAGDDDTREQITDAAARREALSKAADQ
jgi:tetratricopeptide (TPR) repeat protein